MPKALLLALRPLKEMVEMLMGELLMIEISDKRYWKELNWHDAKLYCSLLVIDGKDNWRMIRRDELEESRVNYDTDVMYNGCWFIEIDDAVYKSDKWLMENNYWVIPVRDV